MEGGGPKQVPEDVEVGFAQIEELGMEKPAKGRTMELTVIERMMNHWPNSKQIRVMDCNSEARSVFFYEEQPKHFAYEDLVAGVVMRVFEPRAHFFMDGQIGLRIEDTSGVTLAEEKRDVDIAEQLKFAEGEKLAGTVRFKQEKWEQAAERYAAAIRLVEKAMGSIRDDQQEEHERAVTLLVACYLNVAAALLKDNKSDVAIKNCRKANELRPSAKGYFRIGQACVLKNDQAAAAEALKQAAELDPNDGAIKKLLSQTLKDIRSSKETEKKLWSGKGIGNS